MTLKGTVSWIIERVVVQNGHHTKLKAGDKAPTIEGVTETGAPFDTASIAGKKVILYFYPKDETAGCTAQACNLRDNHDALNHDGYVVIGVSADSVASHQRFSQKHRLPFPLIADPERKLIRAYDVWGDKRVLGKTMTGVIRTTFVIDERGIIEKVIEDISTADHAAQIA